jgi:hypothetical protein
VLAGVEKLLPRLIEDRYLVGLVTGNTEAVVHIKLHRFFFFFFWPLGLQRRPEVAPWPEGEKR